jgi:hypothetical protein
MEGSTEQHTAVVAQEPLIGSVYVAFYVIVSSGKIAYLLSNFLRCVCPHTSDPPNNPSKSLDEDVYRTTHASTTVPTLLKTETRTSRHKGHPLPSWRKDHRDKYR